MPVNINENTKEKVIDKVLKHIKGFSMIVILLAIGLIYLGLIPGNNGNSTYLKFPEALIAGGVLLGTGFLMFITETIYKLIKFNLKLKHDEKISKKKD